MFGVKQARNILVQDGLPGRNMPDIQAIFIFIKGKAEDVKINVPEGDYPAQREKRKNKPQRKNPG